MFLLGRSAVLRALAALWLVALCLCAAAKPPERKGRDTLVIDGVWKFLTDPENKGERQDWTQAAPAQAKEITVPGLWNTSAAPGYSGVAWYWREFEAPAGWKGQTVRLRFEAAADKARVWLNGLPLGEHTDGATPFEFNVTGTVRTGAKNTLAVRVEGDARTGAGLWQGVLLMAHDEAYIADAVAQGDALGHLNAAVTLRNTSAKTGDATLDGRVVAANAPTRDILRTHQELHVTPGRNLATLLLTLRGKRLQRWSPQTPFLYRLQLVFHQEADILDLLEVTFGFRQFDWKESAITLNGQPLQLAAIAPRPSQPIVIATTEDAVRTRDSLRRLKEKGTNLIYLEAPPPVLLRLADEEGLLVVEGPRQDAKAGEEMRELILRDRSHPCILAWNLGDVDTSTAKSARQLDSTRFLLVGPAAAPRLWPPGQNEPSSAALPPGFLPSP